MIDGQAAREAGDLRVVAEAENEKTPKVQRWCRWKKKAA